MSKTKTKTIAAGQTFVTQGTLAAGDTVTVDAGTPSLSGGEVVVNGMADNLGQVTFQGSYRMGVPGATGLIGKSGVLTNQSDLTIDGATAPNGAEYRFGAAASVVVAGVLNNEGGVTALGGRTGGLLDIVAGGTIDNSGEIALRGGSSSSGDLPVGGAGATLNDAGVLTNTGGNGLPLIRLYGGYAPPDAGIYAGGAVLNVTGVLVNAYSSQINIFGAEREGGGNLGNATGGAIDVGGTGYLNNLGMLTLQGSEIRPYGTVSSQTVGGGVLRVAGVFHNGGQLEAFGGFPAVGESPQAATIDVTGKLINNYELFLSGGFTNAAQGGGISPGAQLLVEGTLFNDPLTYHGRSGSGITANGGYGSAAANAISDGSTIVVSGTLLNANKIMITGGSDRHPGPGYYSGTGAMLIDSGTLINNGLITVGAGAVAADDAVLTVTSTGTLTGSGTVTGGGMIDNLGTIRQSGEATISVGRFVNDGVVTALAGATVTIDATVSADAAARGSLVIDGGATLLLDGGVGHDQTVAFAGPGGTLVLGHAGDFAGVLSNLGAGDMLDLAGLTAIGAADVGGQLVVDLQGGGALHFALAATADEAFGITSDGHGGTAVTVALGGAAGGDARHGFAGSETAFNQVHGDVGGMIGGA